MLVIPAIYLLGSNVVRLRQGDPGRSSVYADDPLGVAQRFVDAGARGLHVYDVDSLVTGELTHLEQAAAIARATGVTVQFAGSIGDCAALERALGYSFSLVSLRADRVAGGAFVRDALAHHAERLTIGLDVRDGNVQVRGPDREGPADPVALARELVELGARRFIYSDLNRDGMLGGPNYAGLRALLRVVDLPITASGGIAHRDHIRNLERLGVEAVIIGKALYTGDLSLRGHLDARGHWRD